MDEFSDFQMAVGHNHKKSTIGGGNSSTMGGGTGVWVMDHSPVHSMSSNHFQNFQKSGPRFSMPTSPAVTLPLFSSPLILPPTSSGLEVSPEVSSVGSRLANYNLGIKSSSIERPSPTGSHATTSSGGRPNSQTMTTVRGSNRGHNQSLLMGEEDRYAALRTLVDATSEDSQKSCCQSNLKMGDWQVEHKQDTRRLSKSNLDEEFTSDFGDFQSFTGSQPIPTTVNFESRGESSISSGIEKEPNALNSQHMQEIINVQNEFNFDLEFGDFESGKPSYDPVLQVSEISSINLKTNRSVMASSAQNQSFEQFDFFSNNLPSHEITTIEDSTVTNGDLCSAHLSVNGSLHSMEPFQRPSFIKTSLIRYDAGISEIDTSKCASVDESNNESLECVFMGQKHVFNTLEKQKSLDISPETRSLASLDLGNYYTSSEYNENGKFSADQLTPHCTEHVLNNKFLMATTPISNLSHDRGDPPVLNNLPVNYKIDKYQCFKEEIETEKERNSAEWIRCLINSRSVISNAISLFNGASSSEVIREVVSDEKGLSYVQNLLEVFLVCNRIHKSWQKLGGSIDVGSLCNEMQTHWETLSSFFIGTSVTDLLAFAENWREDVSQEGNKFCSVCMLDLDEKTQSNLIDFGGKFYHSTCANLWLQIVDTDLPSLSNIPLLSDEK